MKTRTAIILGCAVAAAAAASPYQVNAADALAPIEAKVRADYPGVEQLSSDRLSELQSNGTPLVLFDSRSAEEYAVSHLPGARHVDPGIWASTFAKNFAADLKGKTVVVYCSVGVRSSKLAERIAEEAKAAGATAVYNLEGGLFRWHNERRPLVNAAGPTDEIHPYDSTWGRFIENQSGVAYEPSASRPTP